MKNYIRRWILEYGNEWQGLAQFKTKKELIAYLKEHKPLEYAVYKEYASEGGVIESVIYVKIKLNH